MRTWKPPARREERISWRVRAVVALRRSSTVTPAACTPLIMARQSMREAGCASREATMRSPRRSTVP